MKNNIRLKGTQQTGRKYLKHLSRRSVNEVSPHTGQNGHHQKCLQIINAGESVEEKEPSYTVGGNVNWCSHYGEQYGGSLKN